MCVGEVQKVLRNCPDWTQTLRVNYSNSTISLHCSMGISPYKGSVEIRKYHRIALKLPSYCLKFTPLRTLFSSCFCYEIR